MLPAFSEEDEKANQLATSNSSVQSSGVSNMFSYIQEEKAVKYASCAVVAPFHKHSIAFYIIHLKLLHYMPLLPFLNDTPNLFLSSNLCAVHIGCMQVGVLKIHNSGLVTSTSSNNNVGNNGNNSNIKTIQIQSSPSQQTIANAQVCLDSMALSDVDVRILTIYIFYIIIILSTYLLVLDCTLIFFLCQIWFLAKCVCVCFNFYILILY